MPNTSDSIIVIGINLITGLLGMPLVEWLKAKWKMKDARAFLLSAAVAVILAIVDLSLAGALRLDTVTLENFYEVYVSIFFVSQAFYRLFTEYKKSGGLG